MWTYCLTDEKVSRFFEYSGRYFLSILDVTLSLHEQFDTLEVMDQDTAPGRLYKCTNNTDTVYVYAYQSDR